MCFQSPNLAFEDALKFFFKRQKGLCFSLTVVSPVLGTFRDHSMGSDSVNSRLCWGDGILCLWVHPFGLDGEGAVPKQIMNEVGMTCQVW